MRVRAVAHSSARVIVARLDDLRHLHYHATAAAPVGSEAGRAPADALRPRVAMRELRGQRS